MEKVSGKIIKVGAFFVVAALLINFSGIGQVAAEKNTEEETMPAKLDKYVKDGKLIGANDPETTLVKNSQYNKKDKSSGEGKIIPGKIIVKMKAEAKTSKLKELNKKYKVKETKRFFADQSTPEEIVKKLQKEKAELEKDISNDENKQKIKKLEQRIENLESLGKKLEKRQERSLKKEKEPNLEGVYILEISEKTDPLMAAREYANNPAVEYAEPVREMNIMVVPNDPYYSSSNSWGQGYEDLWGLKKIKAAPAWDVSEGAGVTVAVVDTGLDYNHEDISGNALVNAGEIAGNGLDDDGNGFVDDVYGWDFFNNDKDPVDDHGHGTHVSGTIAATGNNNLGIIGVAPQAKILPVKSLNQYGGGYTDQLAQAIKYAADRGADVINASWGGAFSSKLIEDAVNYAHSQGCVFVAAAGNSGSDGTAISPANLSNVITVSAVDHNDNIATFSSYGSHIDVAAPGGESGYNVVDRSILSLRAFETDMYGGETSIINSKYYLARGTSMAAPHVAGLAALIVSMHPEFSNEEVRQVIRKSADDLGISGFDVNYGFGRINTEKALGISSVCVAQINVPKANYITNRSNSLAVSGTADCSSGMKSYKLEYATDISGNWTQIGDLKTTAVANGVLAQWMMPNKGEYVLRLTVTDNNDGVSQDIAGPIYIDPDLKNGWPFDAAGGATGAPVIADLNNDKQAEIIFVSDSRYLFVTDKDGQIKAGWPVQFSDESAGHSSIAVGDLDGDGRMEIVLRGGRSIMAYKSDGNSLPGWPVVFSRMFYGNGSYAAPVIADINNDGTMEIVVTHLDGQINVFGQNGKNISGWPRTIATDVFGLVFTTPLVVDLDGNGSKEIIINDNQTINRNGDGGAGKIYAFWADGEIIDGWPKDLQNGGLVSSVAGDIDKDGKVEVIAAAFLGNASNFGKYYIHIFDKDGNEKPGWPLIYNSYCLNASYMAGGLALADISGDSRLEIIMTTGDILKTLHAFGSDGSLLWSSGLREGYWFLYYSAPVVADVTGDGRPEIILAKYRGYPNTQGKIYIYDFSGQEISGLGKIVPEMFLSTMTVGDIDNDEKNEILAAGYSQNVYAWETDGRTDKAAMPWPTFQQNFQRNGTLIQSSSKSITTFSFAALSVPVEIEEGSRAISALVPYGTDVAKLVPIIEHNGVSIWPESGVVQDFTNPVVYTVTAEDGTTQGYTITVMVAKNPAKQITSFIFDSLGVTASVNEAEKTITATVPYGTNVAELAPTIVHTGASVSPASGEIQNFINPVNYTVTAEDGTSQTYTATIGVAKNPAKQITAFMFEALGIPASINETEKTISAAVSFGTDVTSLVPTITHTGASINPASGAVQNFTNSATYTVTAEDGTSQAYAVSVNIIKSSNKDITKFVVRVPIPFFSSSFYPATGAINQKEKIIAVAIPAWPTVGNDFVADVTHTGLSVNPVSGTSQNFATSRIYAVTAQDGTAKDYKVYVIKGGLRPTMLDTALTYKKREAWNLIKWINLMEYYLTRIDKDKYPKAYAAREQSINYYWGKLLPILASL